MQLLDTLLEALRERLGPSKTIREKLATSSAQRDQETIRALEDKVGALLQSRISREVGGNQMYQLLIEILSLPIADTIQVSVMGGTWKEPLREQATRCLMAWKRRRT